MLSSIYTRRERAYPVYYMVKSYERLITLRSIGGIFLNSSVIFIGLRPLSEAPWNIISSRRVSAQSASRSWGRIIHAEALARGGFWRPRVDRRFDAQSIISQQHRQPAAEHHFISPENGPQTGMHEQLMMYASKASQPSGFSFGISYRVAPGFAGRVFSGDFVRWARM